jgi:hypothetical protein
MNQSTIILENHFNSEDLEYLRKLKAICKEDPNSIRSRLSLQKRSNKLYVCSNKTIVNHNDIAKWINERLPFENKDEYEFQSINFYEIQVPFGMHSDTSADQKYFYQGIIPLGVDPADKDAYTLIFDQTSEENVEWIHPIYEKPDDYKPFFNKPVRDPYYFDNWKPDYKLSDEDCKKWFGNHWKYWQTAYEGFTVHTEYKWNIGDLFLFDSRHMHCATALEEKGINSKEGLLFILKKKDV